MVEGSSPSGATNSFKFMKNKSKYRIVHVVDDVFYGTYYKVQKWERHLLFFHWWTNICFYKRYNKNNNLDPYWWDCRYKTYSC